MDIKTTIAMIMASVIALIEIACIIICIWTMVSLVDVSIHNFTMNYEYSNWNLFEIIFHIND